MEPQRFVPQPETKLHFLDYWRIIRIRKTVILAVFMLVLLTATVVTFLLPESFASVARIKVEREGYDIEPITGRPYQQGYDPYFIQTEFEVIQSSVVLNKVIEALNLNEVWQKKFGLPEKLKTEESFGLLKRMINLRPVRNTSLIEIRVFSDDPEEAARLANAIAQEYRDYRLEQRKQLTLGGLKILREQFEEHEKKIRAAQEELFKLRKELNISDYDAASMSPTPHLEQETLRRIEALRIEAEARYTAREKLLSSLKPLSREELKKVLPTAVPDQLLASLLEQLALAEQKLIVLRKDYGDEYPETIRVAAQVEDLNKKINDRIDGILDGLEKTVEAAKAEVENLRAEVEKARKIDQEKADLSRPYYIKKQELSELIRFRDILAMRIAADQTDVQIPRSSVVEIVDPAVPNFTPVRPNKTLNILLGAVIGLVVGVGLAFFIEYLDTSVKTIDDVERALQAPVLGVIPQNVGNLLEEGAESPHAEAYRVLRTNILFSRKDERLNTICVVSAGGGEGKTTTIFNLAVVFAQAGQRVLLCDSDLRRPALHKLFKVSNSIGLTSYLLKQHSLEEVIQTTSLPTLDFMPSGKLPSSSMGLLSSSQMKDLIAELKQRYDFVFFDSPPIMGVSDAAILASMVDMTLQVIQYRRYPQPMYIRAKQMIEKVGGNLIGIVLNNINVAQEESYYYYYGGYYHDYYQSRSAEAKPEEEAVPEAKPKVKPKY
ncbi:MAG: polysaccharide biosynthesis tyrosine autokinase [Verrucomicrobiales bacterium]|nr:polysaccharide biosynthesis tyrosine autokinase [Verrucomicrobiales bacterium]